MASAINKIVDGPQHAIIHVVTDTAGDSADEVIYDTTAAAANQGFGGNKPVSVRIEEIWFTGSVYTVLEWDAGTDDPAFVFGVNAAVPVAGYHDFRKFGGLKDPQSSSHTGKLQVTTTGAAAGRHATFIVKLRKIY